MKLNFYNINSSPKGSRYDKLKAVYTLLVDEKEIKNVMSKPLPINIRLKEFFDNNRSDNKRITIYSEYMETIRKNK